MKNKNYLIFSILLMIFSLILLFVGAVLNFTLFVVSLICFFIGIALLMHWSTIGYKWICDECGETFEITFSENIFGINHGENCKSLYCPKCNKKTMCKGISKQ
ncbi:hypothetical protein [Clostridium sp. ATCC 25772]|uniref:hypothetical protein n=1 Tax=Clostridium sp. ATCC 25772 TaxID=1676991 RepID=UPI0007859BEE|nr:hypothetical protein [Clostridium sp. ATCC 25772]